MGIRVSDINLLLLPLGETKKCDGENVHGLVGFGRGQESGFKEALFNILLLPLGEAMKGDEEQCAWSSRFWKGCRKTGLRRLSSIPSSGHRSTQTHKDAIVIGAQMVQNITLNHIRHVSDGTKLGGVIVAGT